MQNKTDWYLDSLQKFSFKKKYLQKLNIDAGGYGGIAFEIQGDQGKGIIRFEDFDSQIWSAEFDITSIEQTVKILFDQFQSDKSDDINQFDIADLKSVEFKQSDADPESVKFRNFRFIDSAGVFGPTVCIDPVFEFYQSNSWSYWAKQIKNDGYTAVDIVIIWNRPTLDEQKVMVAAFHEMGIACRLRIFPTTDGDAYENHPEWRQKMLDGGSKHDWRVYLCPNDPGYSNYIENKIETICREVPYDAIQLAEPWFEVWGGPYAENPARGAYACLCDDCSFLFERQSGLNPNLLVDKDSSFYFLKPDNQQYYEKWQEFRINSVNDFSIRCYKSAIKGNPSIKKIHMYLSDCRVDLDAGREYQAMDLEEIVLKIQPDMLTIQDAWQDWTQPDLKPDFILDYGIAYVDRIKNIAPELKLQTHLDIGSRPDTKRDYDFISAFSVYSHRAGFDSPSYYEYSIQKFHER